MKPNLKNVQNEVENILDYLVDHDIAFYPNTRHQEPLGDQMMRLSWQRGEPTKSPLAKLRFGSWREYREFVESGRYSFMLEDGSFFFLSFEFKNSTLFGHSLLFYPCPAIFNIEDALEIPLLELVEFGLSDQECIQFRSPVRFDYDNKSNSLHHPGVHMHMNSGECRVGVKAPLSPSMFVSTTFRFYYFDIWSEHKYLQNESRLAHVPTITDEQRAWPHLTFL